MNRRSVQGVAAVFEGLIRGDGEQLAAGLSREVAAVFEGLIRGDQTLFAKHPTTPVAAVFEGLIRGDHDPTSTNSMPSCRGGLRRSDPVRQ